MKKTVKKVAKKVMPKMAKANITPKKLVLYAKA